jgi:cytochrome c-type biogenesis protein CcmH
MLFWVIAAVLTLVASLAVLLPLAAQPKAEAADSRHDLEVYRDQLSELDRDLARGLIQPAEAEQARAEVARRIIHLDSGKKNGGRAAQASPVGVRLISVAAVLAVPLISWGTYARLGSPDIPSQPLSERLAKDPAESTIDELVARAEAHLVANPDDGQGWEVLAPIYLRTQRLDEAANAYRNAIRLLGSSAARQAALGEVLVSKEGGAVSADARAAFDAALKLDPANPKAAFFLALGLAQEGRGQDAAAAWQRMRAGLPQGSPWLDAVDQALAQTQAPQPVPAANQPSKEDMEAAASMSAEDRASMIEGMVKRLDEKLGQNPDDMDGWMRLIRSYLAMGEAGKARDALGRAVAAFGADSEKAKTLIAFASSNGLKAADQNQ